MAKRLPNFRNRIFASYILLLAIVFVVAIPTSYFYMSSSLRELEVRKLEQICSRTVTSLDERMNSLNSISLYIAANPIVREIMRDATNAPGNSLNSSSIKDFTATLVTMNVPAANAGLRLSVYNNRGFYQSAGYSDQSSIIQARLFSPEFREWYGTFLQTSAYSILAPHNDYWSADQDFKPVSLIRPLIDSRTFSRVGLIEVQMPYSSLAEITNLDLPGGVQAVLFDQEGQLITLNESEGSTDAVSEQDRKDVSYLYAQIGPENQGILRNSLIPGQDTRLIVYSRSNLTGWVYLISMPFSAYGAALTKISITLMLVMVLMLLLLIFIAFMASKTVAKPLMQLRDQVQSVSLQNLSIELSTEGPGNEINQLNEAFNQMFERLRESMDEVAAMRLRELQAHLIALQAQIDPHFIFNILSIITAIGREKDMPQVVEISNHLAAILRYSTSNERDLVTLEQEIAHIESYMILMKLRYEEQLEYSIEMEPGIQPNQIRLPRLSLQPIIENTFRHGLRQVLPPWRIEIKTGLASDGNWWISVSENGIGMKQEEIERLDARLTEFYLNPADHLKEMKLGGMGLVNTLARFKFLYKDRFRYQITSVDSGYDGFKITLSGALSEAESATR